MILCSLSTFLCQFRDWKIQIEELTGKEIGKQESVMVSIATPGINAKTIPL
jgi:hypothetical protein